MGTRADFIVLLLIHYTHVYVRLTLVIIIVNGFLTYSQLPHALLSPPQPLFPTTSTPYYNSR